MEYEKRARRFYEKYAPEFADNGFAVAMLAAEFEAVAREQIERNIELLQEASANLPQQAHSRK